MERVGPTVRRAKVTKLQSELDAAKAASAKDREWVGRALDKQKEYLEQCQTLSESINFLRAENAALRKIAIDLHWMARRYADRRYSYVVGLFNDHTRTLLALGMELNATADKTIWATDGGSSRFCDRLTDAQATPGTPEAMGVDHG
jgi:hypothetical protein